MTWHKDEIVHRCFNINHNSLGFRKLPSECQKILTVEGIDIFTKDKKEFYFMTDDVNLIFKIQVAIAIAYQ